jgi:hypothetical protein
MKILLFPKVLSLSLFIALAISFVSCAENLTSNSLVKQSSSGICHDKSSGSFNRTKNYISFDTIAACIDAGGRLPKGKTYQVDNATNKAIDEGREFVTLYDRSDWPHWLDNDKDCQNTRHEILIQTSTKPGEFKGTDNECNVLAGEWYDSYSGDTFTISKSLGLAEMWFYGLCTDFSR